MIFSQPMMTVTQDDDSDNVPCSCPGHQSPQVSAGAVTRPYTLAVCVWCTGVGLSVPHCLSPGSQLLGITTASSALDYPTKYTTTTSALVSPIKYAKTTWALVSPTTTTSALDYPTT